MTHYNVSQLAADPDFLSRVTASYSVESLSRIGDPNYLYPESWTAQYAWLMAAQPGFGEAYAYAILTEAEEPGRNPAVITDAQITAGVQSILAAMPPPHPVPVE